MDAPAFLAAAARLPPLGDPAALGEVLLLAPHPDDESLGCGALVAALAAAGHPPLVVAVSDGAASHLGSRRYAGEVLRDLREGELRAALLALGCPRPPRFLRLPDAAVPRRGEGGFADALGRLRSVLAKVSPATLLTTWRHDPHRDHGAAFDLAAALRAGLRPRPRLLEYPVWGRALSPGTPVGGPPRGFTFAVGPFRAAKAEAIARHRSQVADLVDDDPAGFRLPPAMIEAALLGPEVFLEADP
ncbi:MAG: PIG-L family deacetylase [Geminicoccaceae bacterium]|nr:PIG-L family deacetylase [Geminicoccaceae bacterium]